jgi:prolipoprotein diacylglyceryltransferase
MGFYGGLIGTILGAALAAPTGINLWTGLGALCVAAPFIQALGRLRCLVQGCCHGRPTGSVPGISYTHPRSRVCRLSDFGGAAIHATQLYSIAWNGLVACVLVRLVTLSAGASALCAAYFILSGMGRFVEEAYRGEPQTHVLFGLRLYQWAAVASIVAGAVISCHATPPLPSPHLSNIALGVSIACGLAAWFVCGVDFPESSKRFARLT